MIRARLAFIALGALVLVCLGVIVVSGLNGVVVTCDMSADEVDILIDGKPIERPKTWIYDGPVLIGARTFWAFGGEAADDTVLRPGQVMCKSGVINVLGGRHRVTVRALGGDSLSVELPVARATYVVASFGTHRIAAHVASD